MKTLYIGGQKYKNNSGSNWKIYLVLFLILGLGAFTLKLTGPLIVEKWINEHGASAAGYAFSIRDVDISLSKGEMELKDVKIFNPKTQAEILEAPHFSIHVNWQDFFLTRKTEVSLEATEVDLILSKDFSSEMARIKAAGEKAESDFYLDSLKAKIAKLNIIEKKENLSRTILELKNMDVNVKDVSLLSINKKTIFNISSQIADGGKLQLSGKTNEESGRTPWTINGSLKGVSPDIFNKIAGDKLPFAFNESSLNAEIVAYSDRGVVSGEISPEIKRLNLLVVKPGVPTQSIARALTDELTFTLPFTLKDKLTLEYEDTYRKLKSYRKYPAAEAQVSQAQKAKSSDSFWPF